MSRKRVHLLLLSLAAGSALLAIFVQPGASRSTASQRDGGIFRIHLNSASGIDYIDPALASTPAGWAVLDTTCARLMTYPDKPAPKAFRLVTEVAAGFPRVSKDGTTYTFALRTGFRFSDGTPVRASAFARAINRTLAPAVDSPGAQYTRDIAGAADVLAGRTTAAAGVVARGNTLVVRFARPVPDFLHRTASTFFCAVPPTLPADPEGVNAHPGAGPYYVADYRPGERVVIRRNRHYGGKRPHHVDGFDVDLRGTSPQEVIRSVDRGAADWTTTIAGIYFDPSLALVSKYGINRSQLFVRRGLTMKMFAFNSARPLFRDNPNLRKAVNFALDRWALKAGPLASQASDQYLPSIMPGFKDASIYPLAGDLQRARELARGNLRGGKLVLYTNDTPLPLAQGQLLKQQLAQIGLEVEIRGIPIHSASSAYFNKLGNPGEPWDMALGFWTPAYIDPYAYINLLFDAQFIGNTNFTRFQSGFDGQMRRAARLPQARDRNSTYGALDVRIAREAAPVAAIEYLNEITLVSKRVGCITLRPTLDLTTVCLK